MKKVIVLILFCLLSFSTAGAATIELILVSRTSTVFSNMTGLKWAWFDESVPSSFTAPTDQGTNETTDENGLLVIELQNTTLTTGQTGFLIVSDTDGTAGGSVKSFAAPMEIQ